MRRFDGVEAQREEGNRMARRSILREQRKILSMITQKRLLSPFMIQGIEPLLGIVVRRHLPPTLLIASVIAFVALSLHPGFAAGAELRGRVTDQNGEPVAGAEVGRPETGTWTATSSNGEFVLPGSEHGELTIVVRRVGFEPRVLSLTGDNDTALEIEMRETPFEIEEINVSASREETEPFRSPLPTSYLRGDRLRREFSVSIAHAIEQQAGLRTLSTGGEIGKPVIRGLTGSRVLVLDASSRLEDYSWSDEDGPSIDAAEAERVEVIRGPASVLYGSDALGGVVNVIPRSLWDNLASGEHRVRLESYFASNNREIGAIGGIEGVNENVGWHLIAIGRTAEALHTPAGELEHTGFFAANGEAAIGVRGDRGNAKLRVAHYGGEFKLLEANGPPPGVPEGEEEGPERKLNDERVQLSGDYLLTNLHLEGRFQWQRHSLIELSDDFGMIPEGRPQSEPLIGSTMAEKKEMEAFNLLLNSTTGEVMAHHRLGSRGHGTVGVSGELGFNDTRGPIPLVPDASVTGAAAFAFETVRVRDFDLVGGARVDLRSIDADPNEELGHDERTKRDYTAVTGDAGVVFHALESLAIAGNVGRGFRAPNLFELLANGPHLGEARYELGNPDLDSETDLNLDGSIRWHDRKAHAEVSVYRNQIQDYVYITPTDRFVNGLRVYEHRQDNAVLTGFEISGEIEATSHLRLGASRDQVRGTRDFDDAHLPLIPAPRTRGEIVLHGTDLGWADLVEFGIAGEYHEKQTDRSEFDIETGPYALWSLTSGIGRPIGGQRFQLDLEVRNLFNREYRSYLSRYKEFALDPGRNLIVRVSTSI